MHDLLKPPINTLAPNSPKPIKHSSPGPLVLKVPKCVSSGRCSPEGAESPESSQTSSSPTDKKTPPRRFKPKSPKKFTPGRQAIGSPKTPSNDKTAKLELTNSNLVREKFNLIEEVESLKEKLKKVRKQQQKSAKDAKDAKSKLENSKPLENKDSGLSETDTETTDLRKQVSELVEKLEKSEAEKEEALTKQRDLMTDVFNLESEVKNVLFEMKRLVSDAQRSDMRLQLELVETKAIQQKAESDLENMKLSYQSEQASFTAIQQENASLRNKLMKTEKILKNLRTMHTVEQKMTAENDVGHDIENLKKLLAQSDAKLQKAQSESSNLRIKCNMFEKQNFSLNDAKIQLDERVKYLERLNPRCLSNDKENVPKY